jgi:hypothetical protein
VIKITTDYHSACIIYVFLSTFIKLPSGIKGDGFAKLIFG